MPGARKGAWFEVGNSLIYVEERTGMLDGNNGKVLIDGGWLDAKGGAWANVDGTAWPNVDGMAWPNVDGTAWANVDGRAWANIDGRM